MVQKELIIRHAGEGDLSSVKSLADENRESLGFVMREALTFGIKNRWLLVALCEQQLVGFAHYRLRRDGQTTLYELCVTASHRGRGIGKTLVCHLQRESQAQGKTRLVLKSPVDLPANGFYQHLGFVCRETLPGKKRALYVWEQSW